MASCAIVGAALQGTLDVKGLVLAWVGRNPTLTGRTELWEVVLRQAQNPIIGSGFMSFWSGDRMAAIWSALGAGINQAHSGYLEQYLNLGYVGVAFIAAIMVSALLNVRKQLDSDPSGALLRLCFLSAAALYNYTEASFYGVNNMWVLLLVASIDSAGALAPTAARRVVVPAAGTPDALGRFRLRPKSHQTDRVARAPVAVRRDFLHR
jgi:O-antigen ligase